MFSEVQMTLEILNSSQRLLNSMPPESESN